MLYDSGVDNAFTMAKPDGKQFVFKEVGGALCVLNIAEHELIVINLVADNKVKYTTNDYSKALQVRKVQIKIG